ncbi:hypothetical protein [Arsenicicoccus bolidensis]|uniref:Uncharacterized protein n=1 Tax=Arsenicicoccus bolidensis TaxID=229480 RepID=A0ABS9Q609_9MICO|nr:hypothetical protein [Arsenicicoccus bolidensis]MCG7322700.1 hypothetical protein [Arsenicicoccus bolidensis]
MVTRTSPPSQRGAAPRPITAALRPLSSRADARLVTPVVALLLCAAMVAGCSSSAGPATSTGDTPATASVVPAQAARAPVGRQPTRVSPSATITAPAAPRPPTLPRPTPLHSPPRPPAPLPAIPAIPARTAVEGWSCDQVVRVVNGTAARCADAGDPSLRAQSVGDGESTVGLTDEQQVVHVQRGLSSTDTYLVAMHERGHQELRQRCDTWACGDALARATGGSRGAWSSGPYFARVVEAGASAWARCHGGDNPRYGYRLSCEDLEAAFAAEARAREGHRREQAEYDAAWARYREAYEQYRRDYDTYAAQP